MNQYQKALPKFWAVVFLMSSSGIFLMTLNGTTLLGLLHWEAIGIILIFCSTAGGILGTFQLTALAVKEMAIDFLLEKE